MRSDSAAKIAETAVAAAIQAGVRSRLHGWAGHFGLTLRVDARAGLEARICGFIHDCAKTIGPTSGEGR